MNPAFVAEVERRLRSEGLRRTRPRIAVARALAHAHRALLPEEIHARVIGRHSGVGIVTVYRTLALLESFGFVSRVHGEDGCHRYAPMGLAHGHHVVCRSCGRTAQFPGIENLEVLAREVARRTGFVVEGHVLGLTGLCPGCRRAAPGRKNRK
jgi:Fur family ferric uptake transcriptional regulator